MFNATQTSYKQLEELIEHVILTSGSYVSGNKDCFRIDLNV